MGSEEIGSRRTHDVDPGKCRVHELTTVDWIVCLEKAPAKCPYSSFRSSVYLCQHPDRKRTLPLLPSAHPPPPPSYLHYSNANIVGPNQGIDIYIATVGYAF